MARLLVLSAFGIAFLGCAGTPHLFQTWDTQLGTMATSPGNEGTLYSKQDVSLLLGSPPSRCERVEPSGKRIGYFADHENFAVVKGVVPSGPAARAGLRSGDVITAVDGTSVATTGEDTIRLIEHALQSEESVRLRTNRGEFEVSGFEPDLEQCYWDLSSGRVSKSSASLYMNTYAGTGNANSAGYERFYRATCRFYEGWLINVRSNWQM